MTFCAYVLINVNPVGGGRPGLWRGFDHKTRPFHGKFDHMPIPRVGLFEFRPACSQVELIIMRMRTMAVNLTQIQRGESRVVKGSADNL